MRSGILGLFLGLLLTVSVYGQAPSTTTAGASASSGPAPTAFVVTFKVKEGKNADFEKAFAEMMVAVRAHEPGNVQYDLFRSPQDPQTYVIIERYKDEAARAAHSKSEHGKKLITALSDLLDGRPSAQALVYLRSK